MDIVENSCRQWRVLIYTDSVDFGGHEKTLLDALKYICCQSAIDLIVLISDRNVRFIEAAQCIADKCTIRTIPFSTAPGDVFRVLLKTPKVRSIKKIIAAIAPDLVIVSQGAIALSSSGLGAAKLLQITTLSFLPMAHNVAFVRNSNSIAIFFQEFLYRQLYKIPDFFLTICQTTVDQLTHDYSINHERIFLNYYGLDIKKLSEPKLFDRNLSHTIKHVGIVGRVEFNQKQHDFFMQELQKYHDQITPVIIHVIGDGPDLEDLKQLVEELGLTGIVQFEGWVDDLTKWYQQLDLIVLPSRFEGVPIVMLEAMYWGVPVVASNTDGMKEMLPAKWLYSVGNGKEMFEKIDFVIQNCQDELLKKNHQYVVDCLNIESFKVGFFESVVKCLMFRKSDGQTQS